MSSWTAGVWGCLGIGPLIKSWRLMTYTDTQNHRDLVCFVVLSHPKRLATDEQFSLRKLHPRYLDPGGEGNVSLQEWQILDQLWKEPLGSAWKVVSNDILMWKWHEMTWNDMKWHEMTWNDMKWHEMTWNDMKWHEMTWNDMKWHEMTWNDNHGPAPLLEIVPSGGWWWWMFHEVTSERVVYDGIWISHYDILFIEWGRWWSNDQSANLGLPHSQRNPWRNPCFGPGLCWVFRCDSQGVRGRTSPNTKAIRLL